MYMACNVRHEYRMARGPTGCVLRAECMYAYRAEYVRVVDDSNKQAH